MLPSSGIFQSATVSDQPLSTLQTVGADVLFDTTYPTEPPQWEAQWESWDSGNTSQGTPSQSNTSHHSAYEMSLSPLHDYFGGPGPLARPQGRCLSPKFDHGEQSSWSSSKDDQSPYATVNTQQYYEQAQYDSFTVSPKNLSYNTTNSNTPADKRIAYQPSNINNEFSFTSPPHPTLVNSSRKSTNRQQRPPHSSKSSSKSKSKPSSSKQTSLLPTSRVSSSQKQTHNAIEKQYRLRLNSHFTNLLAKIPPEYLPSSPNNAPTSKAETLMLAEHYIKVLEKEGKELLTSNKELAENLEMLKREWEKIGGWVGSPAYSGTKGEMS